MSIDLKQYKLGDIAISQTGPFGSQLHEEDYVAEGTPIVTVEHLGSIGFTHQNLPFVSESDTNRLKKYTLKEGDIVFSRVGSIDRSVYVKAEEDGWLFSGRCIRVRCNNSVNPRYLSFYFRLPSFKKMMLDLSVGATMPSLNTEIMDNLILYLPSKEHQDVVASLLDDIDSKISNNNAIAAELEGMAKDLYDYWFVQFDFPDENGKPYKSSGGKMVWNEELKREIPEGWEVDRLGKHISSNRGISYNSATLEGDGVPMINLASFGVDSNYKPAGIKTYNGQYDADKILHPFDLIMCNTQQTAIDPTKDIIGKAMLVPDIFDGDVVSSHHVTTITPDVDELKYYLYGTCKTTWFHKYIVGFASGTNILGLDFKGFEDYLMPLPPMRLLKKFATAMKNIESEKNLIITENAELASLRDFLLPMLMNGQVKVKGVS